MEEAKDGDEQVEEDPDAEKEVAAAVVDHPQIKLGLQGHGLRGRLVLGRGRVATLEALQLPSLGLHALEMAVLDCARTGADAVGQIWVLLQAQRPVCKIEARRAVSCSHGYENQKERNCLQWRRPAQGEEEEEKRSVVVKGKRNLPIDEDEGLG